MTHYLTRFTKSITLFLLILSSIFVIACTDQGADTPGDTVPPTTEDTTGGTAGDINDATTP
ncbi:MAG: hypothetical protein ACOX5R_04160 [bacterium]|jgi:hypothetical protein